MEMSQFAEMMAKKYGINKPAPLEETPEPKKAPAVVRTKPNKQENSFMQDLMILKNSLAIKSPAVKDRLKLVNKHAWRDLRLLYALVDRIQSQLIQTMPESRWEYYAALARNGIYHLDIEGPVRQGRMVLISDIHLAQLCDAVMETECIMCIRDGKEIEKCPIRKALMEVAPPTEVIGYSCEYAHAASQLLNGVDVTI